METDTIYTTINLEMGFKTSYTITVHLPVPGHDAHPGCAGADALPSARIT